MYYGNDPVLTELLKNKLMDALQVGYGAPKKA